MMSSATPHQPRFLDRLRAALQMRGHNPAIVSAFVLWAASFIRFHGLRHPETMGEAEVGAYLTQLALDTDESLPRQAQARQALLFLYREFLHRDLGPIPVTWSRARSAGEAGLPARPPLLEQMRHILRLGHYA